MTHPTAEHEELPRETAHAEPNADQVFKVLVAASSPVGEFDPRDFHDVDWDRLLAEARHHSLMPLLAHRVLQSRADLSSQSRFLLKSEFQVNLKRNFAFLDEIQRILRAWHEHGIEAIPYKGPALAEQLWGSFALRECSDLDFLVRREDVDRAGEVLTHSSYRRVALVPDFLRAKFLRNASEEQFRHSQSGIFLELQWSPVPRALAVSFDEDQLWRNRTKVQLAGQAVYAPDPADLLGLLAIHGWKHNWSKLIWVADVAAVIAHYDLDWDLLVRSAKKGGWRRILTLAIEMARRVYGVAAPAVEWLQPDGRIVALAEKLEQGLRCASDFGYLDWHRQMLQARDSLLDQGKQVTSFALTPGLADYAAIDLPRWASGAYRAVRVARVFSLWPQRTLE